MLCIVTEEALLSYRRAPMLISLKSHMNMRKTFEHHEFATLSAEERGQSIHIQANLSDFQELVLVSSGVVVAKRISGLA